MNKKTALIIDENLHNINKERFFRKDIKNISWNTFKKYVELERNEHIEYISVSINHIIEELNALLEDGKYYGINLKYSIDNGVIYENDVAVSVEYAIKELNEYLNDIDFLCEDIHEYIAIDEKPFEIIKEDCYKIIAINY